MELLQRAEDKGYPADFFLSRIRGKRAGLIIDWTSLLFGGDPFEYLASSPARGIVTATSSEGLWRDLMKEYRWIYFRMDRALGQIFSPFFLYCELRTIFICLRHIKGGTASRIGEVLSPSLLSDGVKKILRESEDVTTAVKDIERTFLEVSKAFAGIAGICDREGLGGFERELVARYLVTAVRNGLHPLLKEFFVRIIDSRNIISCYKFLRLQPAGAPDFIPHGSIDKSAFAEIIKTKDITAVHRLAGIKDRAADSDVVGAVYGKMTAFLRRAGRDPLGAGPVLDYLWRCEREVVNMRLLSYGRDIDRETLRKELVS
jgi:vacuolar-type H+-ATPase subunit C/Vma6